MTALLLIGRLCWFVLSRNLMKIPLSLFELQKHHGHSERELIFLGHGNASPWNRITSGSVPRVKHPEPETARRAAAGSTISAILPPSLSLSLRGPLAFLCVHSWHPSPEYFTHLHSTASICPCLLSICCPLRLADISLTSLCSAQHGRLWWL